MNLPNKLTVLRIILMPVMVLTFYLGWYLISAGVFLLAAFTDMLDGKYARKHGLVTVFGKFVDPLADKLINLAALVILVWRISQSQAQWYGIFVTLVAVVIISREIIITSLRALAANEGVVIAADKMGKIKTVLQDIAIVGMFMDEATLIKNTFVGEIVHWLTVVLVFGALVLTVASGIHYFTDNKELMKKIGKDI
ncbi:MAG: CDP-diacylglycerol--glycerol-3-phosphate 3-phosphatidyltransferase [Clostridia bacterium]|nr:CDP-diacylglycerol--glycerol-3-phosphate 3-phosphatidyltransferase [Clostridia bacterium]